MSRAAPPFPWPRVIGFGLGVLRLTPEAFWKMTPREMAWAIEAVTGRAGTPLSHIELAALMTRYPDDR